MPRYKAVTIRDAVHKLGEKAGAKTPLAKDVNEAFENVLRACDVAEWNNQEYCSYLEEMTNLAKEEALVVERSLGLLEKKWDDEEIEQLKVAIEKIAEYHSNLTKASHDLGAVDMQTYRGNTWVDGLKAALLHVTGKAVKEGEMHKRLEKRKEGMALSQAGVAKKKRMDEYVARAEAMRKTARALQDKHVGISAVGVKALSEVQALAQQAEEDATAFKGKLEGTLKESHQKGGRLSETEQATKEDFAELLTVEPKLDRLLSETKGKLKTMRIQRDELKKQYPWHTTQISFQKPYQRIDAAIERLDTALAEYVKGLGPIRELIEEGKKLQ
jgi:hypothetical protein